MWCEVRPSADDPVHVDLDFLWSTEGDDLGTNLHLEPREVVSSSFRPLEIDVLERRILTGGAEILLHRCERTSNGSIDPVLGEQDPAGQPPAFTELALPETDGVRIGERCELVEE
jgi:hypothetical protein